MGLNRLATLGSLERGAHAKGMGGMEAELRSAGTYSDPPDLTHVLHRKNFVKDTEKIGGCNFCNISFAVAAQTEFVKQLVKA